MAEDQKKYIYDIIGEFWRDAIDKNLYEDTIWKTVVDWGQDVRMHAEQVGDSKAISTCPIFMEHTWLYRSGEVWKDTGGFHLHRKESFVVTLPAGQSTFNFTERIAPESAHIWVDGKLLSKNDIYTLKTNRLVFPVPIPTWSRVTVIANELSRTLINNTSLTLPSQINTLSAKMFLDRWRITPQTTYAAPVSPDPATLTLNGGIWYRGETLFLDDGVSSEYVSIATGAATVDLVNSYAPGTLEVYRVIEAYFDKKDVVLEGNSIRFTNTKLPPNIPIQVRDAKGSTVVTNYTVSSVFGLPREFDINTLEVRVLGGSVYNYELDGTSFTTTYAFAVDVEGYIIAKKNVEHMHKRFDTEITKNTTYIDITDDMTLSGTNELVNYPIKIYVDGALLHTDYYKLLSVTRIQFWDPVGATPTNLDSGKVTVVYAVDYTTRYHIHELLWMISEASKNNYFRLNSFGDTEVMPQEYYVDGMLRDVYTLKDNGLKLELIPEVPIGSILQANMHGVDLPYYVDSDNDLDEQYFLANKLPVSYLHKAEYLKDSIVAGSIDLQWLEPDTIPLTEGFTIRFVAPLAHTRIYSPHTLEHLWLKDAYVNENTLYNNFGVALELAPESSEYMKSVIMASIEALWKGSQDETIDNFANIVFGSVFTLDSNEKFESVTISSVATSSRVYPTNPEIPQRIVSTFHKHYALNEYVKKVDSEPFLAALSQNYSPDYKVATRVDHKEDAVIIGAGSGVVTGGNVYDPTKNFLNGPEGEVWVGDVIELTDSLGTRTTLVTDVVDEHTITYKPVVPAISSLLQYKVYSRHTVRLDDGGHLDRALEVKRVNERLKDILIHIYVYQLEVPALKGTSKEQENLDKFLTRALPAWTSHEIISVVPFSNSSKLGIIGGEVGLEEDANWLVLDMTPIDGGDPIGGAIL